MGRRHCDVIAVGDFPQQLRRRKNEIKTGRVVHEAMNQPLSDRISQ